MGRTSVEEGKVESGGVPVAQARDVTSAEIMLGHQGPIKKAKDSEDKPDAPKSRRFRITAEKGFTQHGMKHTLYEGKIVSEANYDIKALRAQGIKMQEILPGDEDF